MTNPIRLKVISVMNEVLEISLSSLKDNPSRDTIDKWDSLKHMEFILRLEEEFDIRFSIDQVSEMNDLNDAIRFVEVNHGTQHNR